MKRRVEKINNILLIEDDPNDVLLIKRAFRKVNNKYSINFVDNGEDAIAYLKGDNNYSDREQYPLPSLIILDLKLPRKSGHEVLEWLKKQQNLKYIPCVILTSSNRDEDIKKAFDLGANSYFIKPASFDTLQQIIKNLKNYWSLQNIKTEIMLGGRK